MPTLSQFIHSARNNQFNDKINGKICYIIQHLTSTDKYDEHMQLN